MMKFSRAIVMLALLSSTLFPRNNGSGKKSAVVEAASTLGSNDDALVGQDDLTGSAPPSSQQNASGETQIDSSPPSSTSNEPPTPLSDPVPASSPVQPSQQEKTILSTILKSFKNGHVDLATLASALNDPNISRLASSLSKANLTKLAEVLEEPQVDLSKLVAALSDPDLNLDKLVATFGDPKVLPPTNLKPANAESGIMSMMKNWAGQIGDSLKGHLTASPSGTTDKSGGEKHVVEAQANVPDEVGSDIPTGFERSTPSPDANTYGKSLITGVEVATGTTDSTTLKEVEGEQSSFNHKLIYYAVAGLLGLSMCIYLATRLSKSYRGEEVEETRSSVRLVA